EVVSYFLDKKCQPCDAIMVHHLVRTIARGRCWFCVLDQFDFSRLTVVCTRREDVVSIKTDFLFLKSQKFSIRLVGSCLESRDESEHVAVELESLIEIGHCDANVQ